MTGSEAVAPGGCSSHGANLPRGLGARVDGGPGHGRFGRMFDGLTARALSPAAFERLVAQLRGASTFVVGRDNDDILAGYTYLGQFVDHDITFDPSSLQQRVDDPDGLVDFRTPRLDLDSVYGSGPSDQPFLYESDDPADRGVKLLVQRRTPDGGEPFDDLPRNAQGRALIGDPRNDEHLIIAQLHLLFIAFHNAVVDHVRHDRQLEGRALFREARRIVRWHYQWIVAHDFLWRIVGRDLAAEVTAPGYERRWFRWERRPFIPVEFSGAAYRYGHSLVRPNYLVNHTTVDEVLIFPAPGHRDSLRGFRALPSGLVIDWRFFYDMGAIPAELAHVAIPQHAALIDRTLNARLFELPPDVGTDGVPELALLNLRRAQKLGLPAGPDVADAMGERRLDAAELGLIAGDDIDAELLESAPLWYHILCEAGARRGGQHLGGVGGGIVAEVLIGLLEGDPDSYLHASGDWTPELEGETVGDFTMPDLVRFARPEYRDA